MKKKIGVITASRAEFGLLELLIEGIDKSEKFQLLLFATGMHLLKEFGSTIDEVRKKFPGTIEVPMYDAKSSSREHFLSKAIARGIDGFSRALLKEKPELIFVLGDRIEVLVATIAAAASQIPIAHIHGGDVADDKQIDGQIRHAITKFAHLHFTATKASSRRVLQMGEEDWRVFHVGGIGMDLIFKEELFSKKELLSILQLKQIDPIESYILCVQHPAISETDRNGKYMQEIIQTLKRIGDHVVIIYPNNDPGSDLIIAEIEKSRYEERFHTYKSLPRKVFLSLMKHANFMIGNSSSGIIESAVFKLPVVNIGVRNLNRECSRNVIFVENGMENIWAGVQKVISLQFRDDLKSLENVYGDGNVSNRILEILKDLPDNKQLLDKKFVSREFC